MPFEDYELGADGWVQPDVTSVVTIVGKSTRLSLLISFSGRQPDPSVISVAKNYDVVDLGVVSTLPAGLSGTTDLRPVNDVLPVDFDPYAIWAFNRT